MIKVNKSIILDLLSLTFPEYTGKKFFIKIVTDITFNNLHWGGGTRNVYCAISLENNVAKEVLVDSPWNCTIEGATVKLPPGVIVAEHSIFLGKDMGITFYVNPENVSFLALDKKEIS